MSGAGAARKGSVGGYCLGAFDIRLQVSVIILVRADHDHFEVFIDNSVSQQIMGGFDPEFVNVDTLEVTFLFGSLQRILDNQLYVLIQLEFLRGAEFLAGGLLSPIARR